MGNMNIPRFVAACILSLGTIAMGNAMDRDVQDGMTGENDGQEYTWEQAGTDSCSLYSVNGCGKQMKYRDVSYPTPNYDREKVNEVQGIILHHTAEPTVERSLEVLTSKKRIVGTHVVIDTDGTRYIMCEPTVVTYHAGASLLNGRERCNEWCLGIEFQGNTLEKPLTEQQIESAVEYMVPLIREYNIPIGNIVTHEMIRTAYKNRHPEKKCYSKVDITQTEYKRVMKALEEKL